MAFLHSAGIGIAGRIGSDETGEKVRTNAEEAQMLSDMYEDSRRTKTIMLLPMLEGMTLSMGPLNWTEDCRALHWMSALCPATSIKELE
jgi:hypothetical protein